MLDFVCERCGTPWHSAASAEIANERGGCQRCGGRLRSLEEDADGRPSRALRLVEEGGSGRDDEWVA